MERAGRLLGNLTSKTKVLSEEDLARAAWPIAVGKRIAVHTGQIALIRDRLVVGVEDSMWQRQLFTLRGQILAKLENVMGSRIVATLEFRVMPQRKAVAREETLMKPGDDADKIADPVLRRIYKDSRRRARA